ncbi:MAG TPA: divergent PAP2 family protein [Anaerolineaceae bacterium]|nr:divergent PAP2 family protein [Anaerolineaceae bacterium]
MATHSWFSNPVLAAGLIAWLIAQVLKLPLDYHAKRRWNWAILISPGGMPSSHTALMTATTLAIGLFAGFDTPVFALGVATSMVVIYDATNIRRQAGIHAQKINILVNKLFSGQPISEEQLREVLGHTPIEVFVGFLLGVVVALLTWALWRK